MAVLSPRLVNHARTNPRGQALVVLAPRGERVLTWSELEAASRETATMVLRMSRSPRRSVLVLPVSHEIDDLVRLVGGLRSELAVLPVPADIQRLDLDAITGSLTRRGADVIVAHHGGFQHRPATRSGTPALPDECLLLRTGGTTGRPRLVVDTRLRSAAARPAQTRPTSKTNWVAGQRQMLLCPVHHAAGLSLFIEGIGDGNTVVLMTRFEPARAVAAIDEWRVGWLGLTPYHMRYLAYAMRHRPSPLLPSLRAVLHMAAPCPEQVKRYWVEALGAHRLFEMYGATEGIGVTVASGQEWLRRPGTVGRGFLTTIRVVDADGHPLPPGSSGEVVMRSASRHRPTYLDRPPGRGTTPDGFASVGDRGRLDADGYLYLADRQAMRIQVGGETVYPEEVEFSLAAYPGVLDAAVSGVPDERLGESLVAAVVAQAPVDGRDLRRHLLARLARHKVPRSVVFVDRLPYRDTGKLDRDRVRRMVLESKEMSREHYG